MDHNDQTTHEPNSADATAPNTATVVVERERRDFLPGTFGPRFRQVEAAIYHFAGELVCGYSGGYWEFVRLAHGGGYLRLKEGQRYKVSCDMGNHFEGELSGDAVGIVVTLFALSDLTFQVRSGPGAETLSERFHQLRDFAIDHPEWERIAAAID